MESVRIMDKASKGYLLGIYEKSMPTELSWEEKLNLINTIGFDFVEISIDETDAKLSRLYDQTEVCEIKHAMKSTGVMIKSMCLSAHRRFPLGSVDDSIRERGLEIFYKAVDLACELGIRTIQLAGYDVYYEPGSEHTQKRFLEYLIKGINYAASKQVICGFETMETDFMNTVTKAMKYVNVINNPYLQVYPDLGNLTNAAMFEGDLYIDIKQGQGHIVAAHLKETVPNVYREVLFTTGHVDFKSGIAELWKLGVRSFVCECWYTGQKDYRDELQFNFEYLTDKIETVKQLAK